MDSFENNDSSEVNIAAALPLISVIVPIYNVEKYVRKCLDSLKGQSMKQIEVICIDDGSTDGSGEIADEYVEEISWPRFKVFHTENRGLSAARNRGIDESRSDWLMFVDSDDWVETDFCRIPHEAAIREHADLVIFDGFSTSEKGKLKHKKFRHTQDGIITQEKAIDCGSVVVWNKFYSKSLFDDIRYPDGHVYEEIATTHKLIYKAKNVYRIIDNLYYYRSRNASISHNSKRDTDYFLMSKKRYKELIGLGYPAKKARIQLIGAALRCYGRSDKIISEETEKILLKVKKIPVELPLNDKKKLLIWKFDKRFYRFIYRLIMRIRFKSKIR